MTSHRLSVIRITSPATVKLTKPKRIQALFTTVTPIYHPPTSVRFQLLWVTHAERRAEKKFKSYFSLTNHRGLIVKFSMQRFLFLFSACGVTLVNVLLFSC